MGLRMLFLPGAILGGMMCTDMGGPVNKAAYAFGVGLLSTQTYGPMAAIMAAGMGATAGNGSGNNGGASQIRQSAAGRWQKPSGTWSVLYFGRCNSVLLLVIRCVC